MFDDDVTPSFVNDIGASKTLACLTPHDNAGAYDGYLTRAEFLGGDPIGFPNQGNIAGNGLELGGHRQSLVSHLTGGALCISHTLSNHGGSRGLGSLNTANYSEQANYWNFWPAGATVFGVHIGPTLVVTLDYA